VQQSDTIKEFLINETYAKLLVLKTRKMHWENNWSFNNKKMPVVGVMHDFKSSHFILKWGPWYLQV
jgi:hypothetical protein